MRPPFPLNSGHVNRPRGASTPAPLLFRDLTRCRNRRGRRTRLTRSHNANANFASTANRREMRAVMGGEPLRFDGAR